MKQTQLTIHDKFIRQVEILACVLNRQDKITTQDLEVIFNVKHATIDRDLNKLRSLGISIHSVKDTGLVIIDDIEQNLIKDLLNQYIAVSSKYHSFEKATDYYVNEFKMESLKIIPTLQRSINNNLRIRINYKTPRAKESKWVIVEPQILYETENTWRLLAVNEGKRKQYVLNRISDVELLGEEFKPLHKNIITQIFSSSVEAWLSENNFNATIELTNEWHKKFKYPKIGIINNERKLKNGNVVIDIEVSSFEELARWICKTGGEVIARKPSELIQMVVNFSKKILSKHKLNK